MKIACVQMDIHYGEPEKNFAAIEEYTKAAALSNVDVIVFPEMWNTGYALTELNQLADENGEKTKELFTKLAKEYNLNIVGGSVATKRGDRFFNTMYVATRTGEIIAQYDKAHLFKLMDEHLFMEAGQSVNTFELDGTTCGGVICYDLRFPEWIRLSRLERS